jgi:ABC-2 type transport system ATP-binding protein
MRRRLELGRGLMHSPRAVPRRADDRPGPADPAVDLELHPALKETEGTTIFMTTHYMDEAELCDRIAIMDRRQIVALDAPVALKARVGADRVALGTADDDAALAVLREAFGVEAAVADGTVTFPSRQRRGVRPAADRGAGRASGKSSGSRPETRTARGANAAV